MRRIIFIILFLLTIHCANAQEIVGKWECPSEFLQSIGFRYNELHGYYTFKKNGKFTLRINGNKRRLKAYRGVKSLKIPAIFSSVSVKVKGRYQIVDGRITTFVKPKAAKCSVSPGITPLATTDYNGLTVAAERRYERYSNLAYFEENTIKTERRGLWTWTKASMQFNGDTLTVGKFIKMVRKE